MREAELQGDEVVGADEAADADPLLQRADRAEPEHAVAAGLEQGAQVRRVVDPVGEPELGPAAPWRCRTTAPCRAAAAATASPPGPVALLPRTTAKRPIAPILRATGRSPIVGAWRNGPRDGRRPRTQRLDRNLGELLQELRVALPGVQVLFGFLLAVPFQPNFKEISPFQEKVYFGTLLCTAISAALLIAPTAYHRLTFHLQQKRELVFFANRLSIAGLGFLALAMTGALMLITDVLFGGVATVVVTARRGGDVHRALVRAAAAAPGQPRAAPARAARERDSSSS